MSEVRARLAPGRQLGEDDFGDLTDVPVESVGWGEDGCLVATFTAELPDEARAAVERRIVSQTPEEETLRADAETYLAAVDPDLTAIRAQVTRLTQIVLGKPQT